MEKGSTWITVGAALCLVAACVSARTARADEGLLARITAYSDPPDVTVSDQDSGDNTSTTCANCGEATSACCCGACGPAGRFWLRDEYVGGWIQGGRVPTLLATSPNGTLPATTPLYGNATYNGGFRSGNWVQGGMWSDCCRTCGVQGDYLFLGRQSSPFFASSDGDPIITRPFIDANTGDPTEQLIAFPNTVVGCVSVTNYNSFAAAGGALRHNLCCWTDCCDTGCDKGCDTDCDKDRGPGCGGCWCEQNCSRLDFVGGFRYYRFNDNLGVREQLTSIDQQSGIPVGTQFNVSDSFRTQNNFYGGEFGLIANRYRGCWMFEGAAKVALGATQQIVAIDGSTVVSFPGQPTATNPGGILALSSNIGHYTHNNFTAIPQLSGRIGYRLTERLTFLVGYTAIYWGRVARAGDQIDTAVNPNLIPPPISGGPNRPSFTLHNSDLWLQGITLGAEYYF